jgi:hypothetical protein
MLVLGLEFVLRASGLGTTANVAQLVSLAPLVVGLASWPRAGKTGSQGRALLTVRSTGPFQVIHLTAVQQASLDHRPQLSSSPQEIVAALNLPDGSRSAPDGPAIWEELPEPLRSPLEPTRYQSTGTEPPPGSDGSFMPPSGPSL